MTSSGFYRYDDYIMFESKVPQTEVLNKATTVLVQAREDNPDLLQGGLLTQAKKALLYVQAERGQDTLSDKKKAVSKEWTPVKIVEKVVHLDEALVSYRDVDWEETARETWSVTRSPNPERPLIVEDVMDGFIHFARNLLNDNNVPQVLKDHILILQSIRTQSDALGSLAECSAIG
ncbi:hypothetical protein BDV19DRAFT_389411 [Aspergillus venezuelensis]